HTHTHTHTHAHTRTHMHTHTHSHTHTLTHTHTRMQTHAHTHTHTHFLHEFLPKTLHSLAGRAPAVQPGLCPSLHVAHFQAPRAGITRGSHFHGLCNLP